MKFLTKKMLAIVALLSVTGYSFGYQFGISNMTDKPIIVRVVERQAGTVDQYALIQPLDKKAFNFGGAWCLKSIEAAPFNPEKRWQGNDKYNGKNLLELQNMAGSDPQAGNIFTELVRGIALIDVEMKMTPNEVFKDTAKAATLLVKGLDKLACKVTDIALKSQTGGLAGTDSTMLDKIGNIAGGADKKAGETKTAAAKTVAEAKADPSKKPQADKAIADAQTATKIAALEKLDVKIGMDIIDDTTFVYSEKPVPSVIAALEKDKALFDDATYATVKGLFDKGSNEDGLTALEKYIKDLQGTMTTKTSIDDVAIIRGCGSCDINTHVDTAKNVDLKSTCSFGLGAIAKASAALTEQSLCQNRDFVIITTGEKAQQDIGGGRKVPLPFDGLIAITKKGG